MEFIEQKCKAVDKFLCNFRAIFEIQKEKHSRCPRCKGSGLMIISRGHASNEPCWFCEGLGIMPIIGVEGFFLAKASSQVKTCDLMLHPVSLVPCEQSFQNQMGTRCKVMRYKPSVQICKFLPCVDEAPPRLTELEREVQLTNADLLSNHASCATLNSLSNLTQAKNEIAFPTECASVIDNSKTSKLHNEILKFIKCEALDISKSSVLVQPKEYPASSLVTQCSHNHSQSNESIKVGQVEKRVEYSKWPHFAHRFGNISSLNMFLIVSALKFAIQKKRLCLHTCPFNDSILTGSGTRAYIHFGKALPTVRHAKMDKNTRRGRNRIREKAQKEANQNARRILQSLTPRTSNMITAPPNETPRPNEIPGVLSLISTKGEGATDIQIRSETSKRLPFLKFQHEQSILEGTRSKNLWMKNFSFELLKEKGLSFTNPFRTLKN